MKRGFHFYETAAGNKPVKKFLNAQTGEVREELVTAMTYIEENEKVSPVLFCKLKNTKGLWEVRVRVGGNIYRILCFFDGAKIIIAANGFQKKTQKTPQQEIQLAGRRQKDYFLRKEGRRG